MKLCMSAPLSVTAILFTYRQLLPIIVYDQLWLKSMFYWQKCGGIYTKLVSMYVL